MTDTELRTEAEKIEIMSRSLTKPGLVEAVIDLCLRVREDDAKRGFEAVKAIEESEYTYDHSILQKAAMVAASIRAQGES